MLVLDGDLGLANVDLLLGIAPQFDLQDVVLGNRTLRDILLEGPDGIRVIPASSGVEELANLDEYRMEVLFRSLAELESETDIILIDAIGHRPPRDLARSGPTGCSWYDAGATAFSDAYAMIKVLVKRPLLGALAPVNQADSRIRRSRRLAA